MQGCVERKASVSVGIPNAVQSRAPVLDVPLEDEAFIDLMEEVVTV
jgi:hypothetical protein